MKKKISNNQSMNIKLCKRMKPKDRLVAFLNHSELMAQIYFLGRHFRKFSRKSHASRPRRIL